tara:strand:- start:143 stop:364 length:222 start_codon:yes stop_codon:yes gene_type:complete
MKTPQVTPDWETGIYIGNGNIAEGIETMTRKQIERKISELQIDIAGDSTNSDFLAMCERFDELHQMLDDLGDK